MRIGRFFISFENIVILLLGILPLIDSLNGFIGKTGIISLGILYKFIFIMILFFTGSRNKLFSKKYTAIIIVFLTYIGLSCFLNSYNTGDTIRVDSLIKLISNVLLFWIVYCFNKNKIFSVYTYFSVFYLSSWCFVITFIIPYFLGIGKSVYAGDIGFKGFYFSQNEVSLVIIILFYISLYRFFRVINVYNGILMILLLLCAILTNTKSCIIACFFGVVIWIIHILKGKKFSYKLMSFIIFVISYFLFRKKINDAIYKIIYRQTILARNYRKSFLLSLLSGRDSKLQLAYLQFIDRSNNPILHLLFGNGFHMNYTIEMDFFDMFFYLGLIGVFFLVVFWIRLFRQTFSKSNNIYSINTAILVVLVFCFSTITGHIIFMGTSGMFFVLLCGIIYSEHINYEKL